MAWGMKNIVISVFGSSIMEGRIGAADPMDRWYNQFHGLLSRAHPDRCFSIINGAVGGESTREIMQRFERDVRSYRPDLCLFMAGANNHDCQRPERFLAEGEFERLVDRFAAELPASTRVVGVVLNPVVDAWHFATGHPAYQTFLAAFGGSLDASLNPERAMARACYARHGWPCLDLYALMSGDPAAYVLPEDGIHLNAAGHALFAQAMFALVRDAVRPAEEQKTPAT